MNEQPYYDFALTVEQAAAIKVIVSHYLESSARNKSARLWQVLEEIRARLDTKFGS